MRDQAFIFLPNGTFMIGDPETEKTPIEGTVGLALWPGRKNKAWGWDVINFYFDFLAHKIKI